MTSEPGTPPGDDLRADAQATLVAEGDGVGLDLEVGEDDLDDALARAYAELPPGGRLALRIAGPHRRLSGQVHELRDRLGTATFAAGFEETTVERASSGAIVLTAARSALAPIAERRAVLSVVMPVYNERATVREVLDLLLAKQIDGVDIEIVVVESNSVDGTREEVQNLADHPRVRLVLEDGPRGKGHAVRAGLRAARGDFVLIQDADLEYDLDDYETVLAPLRALECSFVLGYRRRTNGARWGVRHFEKQVVVGRLMNVGNALFLALFNTVYRSRLRDPFTMYKVFRRDCLHRMRLECNRFDFDWELTAKLLRAGYRPVEVPVSYHSRSFSEGKKVSVLRDPLSWVVACFRYRFAPVFEERP